MEVRQRRGTGPILEVAHGPRKRHAANQGAGMVVQEVRGRKQSDIRIAAVQLRAGAEAALRVGRREFWASRGIIYDQHVEGGPGLRVPLQESVRPSAD